LKFECKPKVIDNKNNRSNTNIKNSNNQYNKGNLVNNNFQKRSYSGEYQDYNDADMEDDYSNKMES